MRRRGFTKGAVARASLGVVALLAAGAVGLGCAGADADPRSRAEPTSQHPGRPTTTTTTSVPAPDDPIDGWRILGTAAERTDTRTALELLRDLDDQRYFDIVRAYAPTFDSDAEDFGIAPHLRRVLTNERERNNLVTDTGNPALDRANKKSNMIWLASSLLHECMQGKMYDDYARAHPDEVVPDNAWSGAVAENKSLVVQAAALRAMGADESIVNYVLDAIDPTDSPAAYWNNYSNGHMNPQP